MNSEGSGRQVHRPRQVVERGKAVGRLETSLVDITDWDLEITSLLIVTKGRRITWYDAPGHQPYLLDDALGGQDVEFTWERFENSSRRYVTSRVMVRD
jgi:hypothetical protein